MSLWSAAKSLRAAYHWDEVNAQTMQSNLVEGLYLCGEVLDIAGPVGGYNLQAAWSTGWVAGEAAADTKPQR